MSTSRDHILGALRESLGRGPLDRETRAALDARIETPVQHPRPAFADDLVTRFVTKLESRAGTVARVASAAAIPVAVEAFRAAQGLAPRAAVGAALRDLVWPADWSIHHGRATIDDSLAVSPAFAAVAETGTLMLLAAPESPTTHNFVPDNQILILDQTRIVRHLEEAWALLRQREQGMPRVVNLISGPSRTADIEQTIQLGAHGPRRLHVILSGGSWLVASG